MRLNLLINHKPLAGTELRKRKARQIEQEFNSILSELATISREHKSWESAAYAIERNGLDRRIAHQPEHKQRILSEFKRCLASRVAARAVNDINGEFLGARLNLSEQGVRLDLVEAFAQRQEADHNILQQRHYAAFAPLAFRKAEKPLIRQEENQ